MTTFAYADPPYLGQAKLYPEHPESKVWDDPQEHVDLLWRLDADYPEGWAFSCSTPSLAPIMALGIPDGVRVAAWVKSFASFKPGVAPAYAWEPILFRRTRPADRTKDTVRDFIVCPITVRKGLTGAKPKAVCSWILDLVGWEPEDDLVDLFPGTGVMGHVVELRREIPAEDALELWSAP